MDHDEVYVLYPGKTKVVKERCHCKAGLARLGELGILKAGEVSEYWILHDEWCEKMRDSGADCNCNPFFELEDGRRFIYAEMVSRA